MSQVPNSNQTLVNAISDPITLPPAPYNLGLAEHTPDGIENFVSGETTSDATPVLAFISIVGDTYSLYDNGVLVGTQVPTGINTGWALPTLSDGVHNLTLTYVTPDGVTSAPLNVSFTVDTSVPAAPVITSVVDTAGPLAGNVAPGGLSTDGQPAINGTGHKGDTISVYDNTTLLGTTTVGQDGQWHFQPAAPLSNGAHNLNATETGLTGTSVASASYPLSVTYIMITGVHDANNQPVSDGGTANGALTITGWLSDPSIAANGVTLDVKGGSLSQWNRMVDVPLVVTGNTFTVTLSKDTFTGLQNPSYLGSGTFSFGVEASGSMGHVMTMTDPRLTYTVTDNFDATAQSVAATHVDTSLAVNDTAVLAAQSPAALHAVVGDHDTFKGGAENTTVDLNADPASYFTQAAAHIQGGAGGIDTLHLTGDHQVLELTSLTGHTAAAKVSGIEAIDLGGAHNALKLSLVDVLNLGETDLFQKDGKQQMLVSGSNGDSVDLSNSHVAGVTDGLWQQEGTTQVSGVTYNIYEHSGAHVELLVQQSVQVSLHA
ncbi:Ig-like domain-containing protein [Caballeronia sp. LjRoot34]|uniref:Ig-like domain-containing protein n=1 Tax=Caballeronia sp. LjRoot34 TaxID=3342325 RepID=UPI003ED0E6AF